MSPRHRVTIELKSCFAVWQKCSNIKLLYLMFGTFLHRTAANWHCSKVTRVICPPAVVSFSLVLPYSWILIMICCNALCHQSPTEPCPVAQMRRAQRKCKLWLKKVRIITEIKWQLTQYRCILWRRLSLDVGRFQVHVKIIHQTWYANANTVYIMFFFPLSLPFNHRKHPFLWISLDHNFILIMWTVRLIVELKLCFSFHFPHHIPKTEGYRHPGSISLIIMTELVELSQVWKPSSLFFSSD